MLWPIVGGAALMGGVGYVATAINRPGVIAQTGTMQRLLFGEFDGRRSKRVEDFHEACVAGGINAEISPDIRREIWQKFVFLVALSGATASMRMPLGPTRDNPLTRQFFLDFMKEVVAVGHAHGIALPADYAEQRMNFVDSLPRDMIASMYHDLQQGKPLELAWLSGGVVDLGTAVGVPTPMNRAVRDLLQLYVPGRRE
jgi:2-dehydropantoate 2-reductase